MIAFEIPLRTVSEANARDHWSKKARRVKHHRSTARLLTQQAARATALPVVVTLTRIAPSSGLDDDNLRSALKAIRDGIADAYGLDDRAPSIEWRYAQRRGATYAVHVEIERRGEDA